MKPQLTPRQQQIADCIVQGLSNKEIAKRLGLAEQTIKNHVRTLCERLGVHNRVQIAVARVEMPLSPPAVVAAQSEGGNLTLARE